jgi:hypothetical protein
MTTYLTLNTDLIVAKHDEPITLAALQAAVGGYIEAVDLPQGITMWVNEEGKLVDEPIVNVVATVLAQARIPGDLVCGNVAFTGGPDAEGDTLPLTDAQTTILARAIERALLAILARATRAGQPVLVVEIKEEEPGNGHA